MATTPSATPATSLATSRRAQGDDTLANDPATGILRGNVDLGSGTDTISNLVGSGTVTKSGTGTLTLTGNNSGFSAAFGTTTVLNLNGGTVSIGSANNMFNGGLTFDGGTLQTTGAMTLPNAITLNAGGGTFDTGADLTLSQADHRHRRPDQDRERKSHARRPEHLQRRDDHLRRHADRHNDFAPGQHRRQCRAGLRPELQRYIRRQHQRSRNRHQDHQQYGDPHRQQHLFWRDIRE